MPLIGLLQTLAVLATPTQDVARERVEALIAQTDALEHLHAEYAVRSGDRVGRLTLDYQRPGRLRVRLAGVDADLDMGVAEDRFWVDGSGEIDEPFHARLDYEDVALGLEEVEEVLGGPLWRDSGGRFVRLDLEWAPPEDEGASKLSLTVERTYFGTDSTQPLLGWLTAMRRSEDAPVLEGDELVLRLGGDSLRVDARTGLMSALEARGKRGQRLRFELEELDLERPPDEGVFRAPEPGEGSKDASDAMRAALFSTHVLRAQALLHAYGLLQRAERELEGELQRLLSALYTSELETTHAEWMRESRSRSAELADWLRSRREAGVPLDTLEALADERRALLVESLAKLRDDVRAAASLRGADLGESAHWRALHQLELRVHDACVEDVVARPLLEAFDTHVDAALDG